MQQSRQEYRIIEPTDIKPKPNEDEQRVALIMSVHLNSDIKFIKRSSSTTPDIEATRLNQVWEIKNIRGNNPNTISRNLKGIYRQSQNIIITLFRTKMRPDQAIGRIKAKIANGTMIKRIVVITKSEKIIVVKS